MTQPYEYFTTQQEGPGVVTNANRLRLDYGAITVQTRIRRNYNVGAIHVSYFIPSTGSLLRVALRLIQRDIIDDLIRNAYTAKITVGCLPGERRTICDKLTFTGRIAIYADEEITDDEWSVLEEQALNLGLYLTFHGPKYARSRTSGERPIAFVSHDSHDKEVIARPLAERLRRYGAPVWFDEFSIPIGASLRESIDNGIRECRKAIVILMSFTFVS